jgi:diguanylate cyclase
MGIFEFTTKQLAKLRVELEALRAENQRLAALAYRDPLTGLRNRRFFSERLGEEVCRVNRRHTVMSLVCVDLNGFKEVNDTMGHAAGDQALMAVGRFLESLTRAEDLCCRVGGDEFVVLLPDTDEVACQAVVERLKAHQAALAGVGLGPQGLAIGAATWNPGDDEIRLLSRADEQMYADKRAATHGESAPVKALLASAA